MSPTVNRALTVTDDRTDLATLVTLAAFWPHNSAQRCHRNAQR